ncbi:hypothetical protein CYMTET_14891 [Cymbomonas tetramitiformis]|uniref:Uncharacterized protein n=1 Tax=Cymbomonas tetramitiformis TaxID=36881 RepID=A0AAE0GFE4_9CHLO|nr:hypothetical protein CYMTET_14891 [Cymbomonas tetramitiformis]
MASTLKQQAGNEWFENSVAFVMAYDGRMQRSNVEPCLYFIRDATLTVLILAYVNDYFITTNAKDWRLAQRLSTTVELLGPEGATTGWVHVAPQGQHHYCEYGEQARHHGAKPVAGVFRAATELVAEHIPGVENTLSDRLSPYVWRKDYSNDWQFRRDQFQSVQGMLT